MQKNRSLLRRKLCLDEMFIPKFLYAIDDKINQWLMQCSQVQNVEETSVHLMKLQKIITKLQVNELICCLPPNIKRIARESAKKRELADGKESTGSSGSGGSNVKKQKQTNNMVRNEQPKADWKLKQEENWNLLVRHKSKDTPVLANGSKACLKYHVKGFCFDDCKFRGSHCQLAGLDEEKTDEYIESLRNQ